MHQQHKKKCCMCEIILGNKASSFFNSDSDSVVSVEKGKFHFLLVEVTKLLTLNSNLAGKSWRGAVLCFSSTEEMSHVAHAFFFFQAQQPSSRHPSLPRMVIGPVIRRPAKSNFRCKVLKMNFKLLLPSVLPSSQAVPIHPLTHTHRPSVLLQVAPF